MQKFDLICTGYSFFLAPMAGYSDLPFRACVRKLGGVAASMTPLVHPRGLLEQNAKTLKLIETCEEDRPLGVQLFGGRTEEMRDAAKLIEEMGANFVDINMGCPAPKVHKSGGGATLLRDPDHAVKIASAVVREIKIPVTVKTRLGWDKDFSALHLAPRLEDAGIQALFIHGRTCKQRYSGKADWEKIGDIAKMIKIPVIGNGDVQTAEEAKHLLNLGCAGVMIGRAALKNPFIFRHIQAHLKNKMISEETLEEKIAFIRQHFDDSVKFYGEQRACIHFRKIMAMYAHLFSNKKQWIEETRLLKNTQEFEAVIKRLVAQSNATMVKR
ncbi:MAG: tRNA dihydrouridine synthase DusB [Verrucomicrobiota bacterium]